MRLVAVKRAKLSVAIVLALGLAVVGVPGVPAIFSGTLTGTLPSGATYLIEVPPGWNGTLVLYSHRAALRGSPNPAQDSPGISDPASAAPVHHSLLSPA